MCAASYESADRHGESTHESVQDPVDSNREPPVEFGLEIVKNHEAMF